MYSPKSFSIMQGRRDLRSLASPSLAGGGNMCQTYGNRFPPSIILNQISGKREGKFGPNTFVRSTKVRISVSSPLIARTFRGTKIGDFGSHARRRWQIIGGGGPHSCRVKLGPEEDKDGGPEREIQFDEERGLLARKLGQGACWLVTVVYVGWLFLLPYAPGDPVWAISPSSIKMLIDLSLNFFFVLPLANIVANAAGFPGFSALAPHPTSEALFNFVLGWTLLFAPLLFTDRKRNRFGGSLELLWVVQMFLTNTVLAPYMAIRQGPAPEEVRGAISNRFDAAVLRSLSRGLTLGAIKVAVTGAVVGAISLFWFAVGRPDGGFGDISGRWEYFMHYVASERLAYAFIWDVILYAIFQPWLIGDNLMNVKLQTREVVRILRFVPYVGLVAYLLGLDVGVISEDERQ